MTTSDCRWVATGLPVRRSDVGGGQGTDVGGTHLGLHQHTTLSRGETCRSIGPGPRVELGSLVVVEKEPSDNEFTNT